MSIHCTASTPKGPCNNYAMKDMFVCYSHRDKDAEDSTKNEYVPPPDWFEKYGVSAFKCPHCHKLTELDSM